VQQGFFFGDALKITAIAHPFQAFQLVDALANGAPVGEHTTQPAMGYVWHAAAHRFHLDGFLRLAFGAYEQHRSVVGNGVSHQAIGLFQGFDRFLQVNDVDTVAFGEDVGLHGGVPLVSAVPKVHAAFQKRFHRYNGHVSHSLRLASASFIPARHLGQGTPGQVGKRARWDSPSLRGHKLSRLGRERAKYITPVRIRPGSDFCGKIHAMDQRELETLLADLPLGGIRYFPKVGSTNDLATRWARAGAADFSLVVADEQSAGRGRLNRQWFTPPGSGLALSVILRPENLPVDAISATPQTDLHTAITRLTALGALAVCETLNEALSPVLPAQIKWPNDVIATRRKLAGVLVELQWSGEKLIAAILGIGVNVTSAAVPPPGEVNFPATCVEEVVDSPVDRWILLHDILVHLLRWREQMASEKFLLAWLGRLAFRGEWVTIVLENESEQDAPPSLEGQVAGLNSDGSLRLRLRSGEITPVHFGEIHLRPVDKPAN